MPEKTFHIITFGCQMNVLDSRWLGRALRARGWTEAEEDEARCVIVNTCSVREKPEQKVYSTLGRFSRRAAAEEAFFTAVGGCVAQQAGGGLLERFPHLRLVFGTDRTGMVPDALDRLAAEPEEKLLLNDFEPGFPEREAVPPDETELGRHPGQAFVSIMQGCDNYCAYCIVPFVRGRQKSRPSADVLRECRELVDKGVREITLLGQNVNSYGLDEFGDGESFAGLLAKVAALPGLARLRFTTSHPKDLAPEVVRAFGEFENLCPHLHLPLQSGSDRILHAMGRGYDMSRYMDIVDQLREARPEISLSTDLIVGFPGEEEEDFLATIEAVERVNFASSFSFAYSDRPGARAERIRPKVPAELKMERLARLQELQEKLTGRRLAECPGGEAEVLVEGPSKKQDEPGLPSWRGRDAHGMVVNFNGARPGETAAPADRDLAGKLVKVRITAPKKHSLWGEIAGEPW
jgi:tRNA-2-methylthio-N6-dimethylallyladenosine synthase